MKESVLKKLVRTCIVRTLVDHSRCRVVDDVNYCTRPLMKREFGFFHCRL